VDGERRRWRLKNTPVGLPLASVVFNERHGGRFRFVYAPLHASWVNQVEIWFGALHRRLIACLGAQPHRKRADYGLKPGVEAF
jgi:hypothetical protein